MVVGMVQATVLLAVRPAVFAVGFAQRAQRDMRRRAADDLGRATLALIDATLGSPYADEAIERVLNSGLADRVADRIVEGPELERILDRALESPAVERMVTRIVESHVVQHAVDRVADDTMIRLRESKAMWELIDEIAQSPAVLEAIAQQGAGFADQVGEEIRDRSRSADARLERAAWRLLRRRARPTGGEPSTSGAM